ncbi:hypothetical protein [Ruania albidiflava]|uniref:hypothetical protein n=1 Tax=Ruania albidiflava TaxID=366586 RepID=UPI0003B4E683|nr:hypothetical protein [Ruania albidiflava]
MTQYQGPQGDPQAYGQQPGYPQQGQAGGGQASTPQQPQAPGGYGQASAPPPPAHGYGQPSAPQQPGLGQQQPGGYAYGGQYPTAGSSGLFDTTFAVSSTQRTAKLAYLAVIVFSGVLALTAILDAIAEFSAIRFGGIASVLGGLTSLIFYGALAFGVLTVGRLVIDFFVQEDKKRQQG